MDYREVLKDKDGQSIFIKTTAEPVITSKGKAILNRQGNACLNAGKIEDAKRIFMTTGYSDGLIRVGDFYRSQGRVIDALWMYWIAPDHNKAEPIIMKLSTLVRNLLNEDQKHE